MRNWKGRGASVPRSQASRGDLPRCSSCPSPTFQSLRHPCRPTAVSNLAAITNDIVKEEMLLLRNKFLMRKSRDSYACQIDPTFVNHQSCPTALNFLWTAPTAVLLLSEPPGGVLKTTSPPRTPNVYKTGGNPALCSTFKARVLLRLKTLVYSR